MARLPYKVANAAGRTTSWMTGERAAAYAQEVADLTCQQIPVFDETGNPVATVDPSDGALVRHFAVHRDLLNKRQSAALDEADGRDDGPARFVATLNAKRRTEIAARLSVLPTGWHVDRSGDVYVIEGPDGEHGTATSWPQTVAALFEAAGLDAPDQVPA